MADRLAVLLEGLRAALRREQLPASPAAAPPAAAPPGLLRQVFGREALPLDPPVAPSSQRGNLSHLFAWEPLDEGPPRPAPPRSPWLSWIFRPEHLDD
jgi:hypothetical protein